MPLRRRRVAVTLLVLLLAAGAAVGGTWLHDRREAQAAQRAEDKRIAARDALLAPARAALRAIPRPAGYEGCPSRPDADLCWTGGRTPQQVTKVLVEALVDARSDELLARCVRKGPPNQVVFCRIFGRFKGAILDTLVQNIGGQVQAIAYAADQEPPDILKNGTLVPLG